MNENWLTFSDQEEDGDKPKNTQQQVIQQQQILQAPLFQKPQQQRHPNPHTQQYQKTNNNEQPPTVQFSLSAAMQQLEHDEIRIINKDTPRMQYRRRQNEQKSVRSDLYLSNLLPIIEFLTRHNDATDVVWNRLGSYPNTYLLLKQLFPNMTFHIFEIFSKPSIQAEQINFYNFSITDEKFQQFIQPKLQDKTVIYINEPLVKLEVSLEEVNQQFVKQLENQKLQVQKLKPNFALCNFQLPYTEQRIQFFQGRLLLPINNTATHAGCKLEVQREIDNTYGEQLYDCKQHEENMFWFNNTWRVSIFEFHEKFEFDIFKRFDHCYDCTCFYTILLKYLLHVKQINGYEKPLELLVLLQKIDQTKPEMSRNYQNAGQYKNHKRQQ